MLISLLSNQSSLEAIAKIGFWFQIAAGPSFKPQATLLVVEDLKRGTNKEMGPKDIFEIASTYKPHILW